MIQQSPEQKRIVNLADCASIEDARGVCERAYPRARVIVQVRSYQATAGDEVARILIDGRLVATEYQQSWS